MKYRHARALWAGDCPIFTAVKVAGECVCERRDSVEGRRPYAPDARGLALAPHREPLTDPDSFVRQAFDDHGEAMAAAAAVLLRLVRGGELDLFCLREAVLRYADDTSGDEPSSA
jgi:hypothetical protein